VAVDDVGEVDLESVGAVVPDVNIEVVQPGPEADGVTMRVHERGAGITEACGTGACAAAYAAARWGMVAPGTIEITVHMDGGDAKVRLGDELVLVGPATYIARIEVA
jgi:diaminopimelate epimerase